MGLFTKTKNIPEEELPPPTPTQVQNMLDKAKPLERHDSYFSGTNAVETENPMLANNTHGHGIWMCCCGYNNTLIHHEGAFKKMTCGSCHKVLCAACITTDIVIPLQDADCATIKLGLSKLRAIAQDFFQVCPDCGLSVRAQIRNPDHRGERLCWVPVASPSHSEICHSCNASAKSNWLKFRIGDSKVFRANPAQVTLDLMLAQNNKQAANSDRHLEQADSQTQTPKQRRPKWLDFQTILERPFDNTSPSSSVTPKTADDPLPSFRVIREPTRQGLPPVYFSLTSEGLPVPARICFSSPDIISPQPIRPGLPYVVTREWNQLNSPQCSLKRTPRTSRVTRQHLLVQRDSIDSSQGKVSCADAISDTDDPTPRAALFLARSEPSRAPDEQTWATMRSALDSVDLTQANHWENVYRLASTAGLTEEN